MYCRTDCILNNDGDCGDDNVLYFVTRRHLQVYRLTYLLTYINTYLFVNTGIYIVFVTTLCFLSVAMTIIVIHLHTNSVAANPPVLSGLVSHGQL